MVQEQALSSIWRNNEATCSLNHWTIGTVLGCWQYAANAVTKLGWFEGGWYARNKT